MYTSVDYYMYMVGGGVMNESILTYNKKYCLSYILAIKFMVYIT